MSEAVNIVKGGNYGDSYYWDYRVWFTYKGQEFTYLGIGSMSGYIPCSDHIGRGFRTMLSEHSIDFWDDYDFFEPEFGDNKILVDLAEKLIKSGKDTLDFYKDYEDDFYS